MVVNHFLLGFIVMVTFCTSNLLLPLQQNSINEVAWRLVIIDDLTDAFQRLFPVRVDSTNIPHSNLFSIHSESSLIRNPVRFHVRIRAIMQLTNHITVAQYMKSWRYSWHPTSEWGKMT